jgi:hypothetical protein
MSRIGKKIKLFGSDWNREKKLYNSIQTIIDDDGRFVYFKDEEGLRWYVSLTNPHDYGAALLCFPKLEWE